MFTIKVITACFILTSFVAVGVGQWLGTRNEAEYKWHEEGKRFHPGMELTVSWNDPDDRTGYIESHHPLSKAEAAEWLKMSHEVDTVWQKAKALENGIISAHKLKANTECNENIAIRHYQTFIFDSVPDNPKWGKPGCEEALRGKRQIAIFRADGSIAGR